MIVCNLAEYVAGLLEVIEHCPNFRYNRKEILWAAEKGKDK